MKNLVFFTFVIFVIMSCTSSKNIKKNHPESFETIKFSEYGGSDENKTNWVQNEQEWTQAWENLHSKQVPVPSVPKIDFDTHSLIVFNFGRRTHGGNYYSVKNVQKGNDSLQVTFSSPKRDPMEPVSMVITNPYLILSIQKTKQIPIKKVFIKE